MQALFRAPFIALLFLWLANNGLSISKAELEQRYSACEPGFIHDSKANPSESSSLSLTKRLKDAVSAGSFLWPLVIAAIAGLLTSLSPCVYPLIPITLGIMGTRKYQNPLHGFFTAFFYVFGMSLIYTILGAAFAYLGILAGSVMQNPFILMAIALLFALLALSMFGLFDVVLPGKWLTKLSRVGGQGYWGAFLMGLVAGIIAAPCTGPVLGFILTFIAENQNVFFGITLMFAFSLGLGLPFLVLGTFSSAISRLPRSGPWMDRVKFIFGAIMLSAAIHYASLALSPINEFLQKLSLLGFYNLLLILAIGFVLLLIKPSVGALIAALSLATLLNFQGPQIEHVTKDSLTWHVLNAKNAQEDDFTNLLSQAKSQCKPMMVDFYADWCIACKQLDVNTFSDKQVQEVLQHYFLVRIDATESSKVLTKLQNHYGITGLPTIIFFDRDGQIDDNLRILGFVAPRDFLKNGLF